jgi:hypothetical protein
MRLGGCRNRFPSLTDGFARFPKWLGGIRKNEPDFWLSALIAAPAERWRAVEDGGGGRVIAIRKKGPNLVLRVSAFLRFAAAWFVRSMEADSPSGT